METDFAAFDFWKLHHTAPYHFPMDADQWCDSMYEDIDSEGRKLFDNAIFRYNRPKGAPRGVFDGLAVYGITAFGFNEARNISEDVHHKVIRDLCFDPATPEIGQHLLDHALEDLGQEDRIYAFFHYFGMSACARHGKLHESQQHIHTLLLENGFCIEHENVYYSKMLTKTEFSDATVQIAWRELNAGGCREFAATLEGREIGWGQVHFLPQSHIAYLRWIYIDDQHQHRGFGTAIMHTLFHKLYEMGIRRFDTDTALSNTAAQGYYEKTGFTNEGITRSYYKEEST